MSKIKICLDAGHYGKYNPSPVVNGYYESEMNWKLHNLLKKYLEQYGIEVIQTRSNQATDLGLTNRGNKAKGCNLFLSIHSNASDNAATDHPLAIVPLNGKGDALGQKLADCVASTMGTKQKGKIWTRKGSSGGEWYGVIRGAVAVGVPGIILEHSYHTNLTATKWLMVDSNLDKLAQAEAKVIAEHYGQAKAVQETAQETTHSSTLPVLKKGSKGASVKALQILLIGYGISCGSSGADGDFGSATDKAVRDYQKKMGLSADGIVGVNTWSNLLGMK